MKSAVTIVGTLLFAAMLVPAAHSQEKAAKLACEGQSKGLRLTPQQFEKLLDDARAAGRVPNFCEAVLDGADLNGAELYKVNLSGAKLVKAHLRGAHLSGAILRGANLYGADLTGADLTGADLSNANMITTVLRRAQLGNADMSKADLTYADMKGTFFEPRIPPDAYDMAFAYYLSDLTYERLPIALFTIREAFKRGGLGQQERKVTYAIKRTEVAKSIQGTWSERIETADSIILPEKQKAGFVEYAKYWLNVVLFDLTFQYGMNAGRPLQILTALIFVFLIPYTIALKRQSGQSGQSSGGIWMVWSDKRVLKSEGTDKPVLVTKKGFRLLWAAFYFSLLSAFNLGWKEINVGEWIARVQSHEYTLLATGWVRTVAGIQSLISVYMVALWFLAYFSTPFE